MDHVASDEENDSVGQMLASTPIGTTTTQFSARDDIILCQYINVVQPWLSSGSMMLKWAEIADKLSKDPACRLTKDGPGCRSRWARLRKDHAAETKKSSRKSGTMEDYDERDVIIQDLVTRITDHEDQVSTKRDNAKNSAKAIDKSGMVMRQMAMEALSDSASEDNLSEDSSENDSSPPTKKHRVSKKSAAERRDDALTKIVEGAFQTTANSETALMSTILSFVSKQNELAAEREARRIAQDDDREKRFQDFMLRSMSIMAEIVKSQSQAEYF
ncbi:hypothetical protein AC1031_001214 [Aphanomyces cochlioides]|nr:hypothetical protein AC1031_001214 [Aphanomyces cochlioides]